MIKAAIVDDQSDATKVLAKLLQMNFPEIQLLGAFNDPEKAIEILKSIPPDILFLDIDMPGANGFEVLEALGNDNTRCIFVTAHEEYAIQAIKANAADYLLKPLDLAELTAAINKVLNDMEKNKTVSYENLLNFLKLQSPRIHVPTGKGIRFLEGDDICYLKANGNYTTIFLEGGKKLIAIKKLHEFAAILPASSFARVHNSFLVNLDKVQEYRKEGWLCLQNGAEIPVSRKYKEVLKINLGI